MSRPMKYGGTLFMEDGGQIVLGKFIEGTALHEGLMVRSIANHEGKHLKIKP